MGSAELYLLWLLLALIGGFTAGTFWGIRQLHHDLQQFRRQMFAYRDHLD